MGVQTARKAAIAALVFVCLESGAPVLADGGFVSVGADVYAPDQKAVIAWDGVVETMILATKLRADDVSDFGWIIPIKTPEMPKVELGEAVVFEYLSEYFQVFEGKGKGKGGGGGGVDRSLDAVVVLAKLELEAFDVTILKATDSGQFHEWLTRNAFKLHPDTEPVLAHYTNEEFFFITAKIAADRLGTNAKSRLQRGIYHPLKITFKADEPFFPLKISSINKGPVKVTVYIFAKGPKRDRNGILEISKWQPVTPELSKRMGYYLPVAGLPQATRLTFDGDSERFTQDVYFQNMSTRERQESYRQDYTRMDLSAERFFRDALARGTVDDVQREISNTDLRGTEKGQRFLDAAISHRSVQAVALVLEAGAELGGALDYALQHGSYDVVEYLLAQGAKLEGKVHFPNNYGTTVRNRWVTDATRKGNTALVELLLECGLSANGPWALPYDDTPLMAAVKAGHHGIARLLLDSGADIEAPGNIADLYDRERMLHLGPKGVGTALDASVATGDIEMVRLLLARGASVEGKAQGHTDAGAFRPLRPLIVACAGGHVEIVRSLLEAGAPVSYERPPYTWHQMSAFYEAALTRHLEIVRLLLDRRPSDDDIAAAVELSIQRGSWDVIKLLVERDLTVCPKNAGTAYVERYEMLKPGLGEAAVDMIIPGTASVAGPREGIRVRFCRIYFTPLKPDTPLTPICLVFKDGKLVESGDQRILLKYLE